ncbi:MAG: MBL fold metallo-hydrolase [Thermoplasmata archaeon]|nr:MBL fold metallo-hydrolase [Thermoplasmata archaeon]
MVEILPGIHQVEGVDPSPDFSTHVYLARDKGPTWTLIDTGLPDAHRAIAAYLKRHAIEPKSIRTILVTHLHRDHVGSLRAMMELTGARTYAHWVEAAYINQRPKYDGPGVPPAEPVEVHERLKDGDVLDVAGDVVAYHTPGHTPGHTSYYLPERKILFTGDLFMGSASGPILTVPEYTHHTPTAQISARRMSELAIDALLIYHGGPYLRDGTAHLQRLVKSF